MPKNKYLAAALSFLIGGLGQLYLGQLRKALLFLLLDFCSGYVYLNMNQTYGMILSTIVTVWSMVDAYFGAQRTEAVKQPEKIIKKQETEPPVVKVY